MRRTLGCPLICPIAVHEHERTYDEKDKECASCGISFGRGRCANRLTPFNFFLHLFFFINLQKKWRRLTT